MTKQLEKQLEFEFKKEYRRGEKIGILGCVADWITAISCVGILSIIVIESYARTPVYETIKEGIKYLFH